MEIRTRLQLLADGLSGGGSVAFTRADLMSLLASEEPEEPASSGAQIETPPCTWRERIWTAPAEVRIGTHEVAEALGKPVSWIYRHTSTRSGYALLPFRKLDGELQFVVGELRAWIRDRENVVQAGRMDSTAAERGLRLAG